MKLSIKKKWFDLIKKGKKKFELRDAHVTLVCEETGKTLRKEIKGVRMVNQMEMEMYFTPNELDELYEDKNLVWFDLK